MSVEILQKVNNRYQTAVLFHKESADLFNFIGLYGFYELHEYQALDEFLTSRRVKRYIIENHGTYTLDALPNDVEILSQLKDNTRFALTYKQKTDLIRNAMISYQKWEMEAKEAYQEAAKELLSIGEVADYEFVSSLVEDVSKELITLNSIILELKLTDYDSPHIADIQEGLKNKYAQLKLNLLGVENEPNRISRKSERVVTAL